MRHLSEVNDGDEDLQYLVEKIPSFDYFELGATYELVRHNNHWWYKEPAREDPPVLGGNSLRLIHPNLYDASDERFMTCDVSFENDRSLYSKV